MKVSYRKSAVHTLILTFLVFLGGYVVSISNGYGQEIPQKDQTEDKTYKKIRDALESTTVSIDLKDTPLHEVVKKLSKKVDFQIILDTRVLDRLNPDQRKVTITVSELKLKKVMKIILRRKDLGAVFKHGVVKIVPEEFAEKTDVRIYDIRELQMKIRHFPPPSLELKAPGENQYTGTGTRSNEQNKLPGGGIGGIKNWGAQKRGGGGKKSKKKKQNRQGGHINGNTGSDSEESTLRNDDLLKEIIKYSTGNSEAWNRQRNVEIEIKDGRLIVRQAPEIHSEIKHLITRLRGLRSAGK